MTGFTKEEILGIKFPAAYFPEDSIDVTKNIFPALFSGVGDNGACEVTLKRQNGEQFPAMLYISRLFDHNSRHISWVGNIIDLTEVKKSKLLSADIQNKYQVIFESIPIGIIHQNEHGEVIESNAAAKEILQLPHHNLITSLAHDAPHSARLRCIRENGGEFTRDELPSAIALRTKNKVENVIMGFQDDFLHETTWVNVSVIPDGIGDDGSVFGTYTMFQNITNIKKYQVQTEKSEREFRALAQNASIGVFRVNRSLQILFANDALIAIADYDSLEQFIECGGIGSLVKDKKKIFAGFRILLRHGNIKNHKMFITSNKGVEKWLLFNATFVDDKIYGTFVDITAIEQLQKQLEQERDALSKRVQERTKELTELNNQLLATSNIKDDFLSTISHELRTPFNSILTLTEALTEGIYGPLTINQINKLNLIIQSGRHLLSLINDLLDLSKINAGKFELEYSSVNLHDMLGMAFTMLSEDINKKNLNVDFKTDVRAGLAVAAEARLARASGRARRVGALRVLVTAAVVGLALVDVDTGLAVAFVADDAGARERTGRVGAQGVAVAAAVVAFALVDIRAGLAVAAEAGVAGAPETANRIGARGVHVATAVADCAFVDVAARLAVAAEAGLAGAREAAGAVAAGRVDVAAAVVAGALVDVVADLAVARVTGQARAGKAARSVAARRVAAAAAVAHFALVDVGAGLAVAGEAGLAGARDRPGDVRALGVGVAAAVVGHALVHVVTDQTVTAVTDLADTERR